jgi:hypothetical protein
MTPPQRTSISRPGRAVVIVIVCLGIAMTIMTRSMHTAIRVSRQTRHELQLEQTRWLLEAATARVASQRSKDVGYEGESWDVSGALPRYEQAVLDIKIVDRQSPTPVVEAVSRIGTDANPATSTQRSARWIIEPRGDEIDE